MPSPFTRWAVVETEGFEPPTPCSQNMCAIQIALCLDLNPDFYGHISTAIDTWFELHNHKGAMHLRCKWRSIKDSNLGDISLCPSGFQDRPLSTSWVILHRTHKQDSNSHLNNSLLCFPIKRLWEIGWSYSPHPRLTRKEQCGRL